MLRQLVILILSFSFLSADEMALQDFISGNNIFSAAVYKKILKTSEENFLVSPFSAEVILALVQNGAKGETAQEIKTALHLPNKAEDIESAIKTLLLFLKNNEYCWHTANKIYLKKNSTIKKEFQTIASQVYEAQVENINFSVPSKAAKIINEWVKKQTENKIQNLMDSQKLSPETEIILINALYFKGDWTSPFQPFLTESENFYKTAKDVVKVDTMSKTCYYNYYKNNKLNATFLEMPFQGDNASMVIALPNEKEGLADLENQIEKVFSSHKFSNERVSVSLPKFKIETQVCFNKILQDLGITKAFMADADFSGIAEADGNLCISEVLQKTFIDVSEKGVEAAAATAIDMWAGSSRTASPPKSFQADHPFIFYIKIKEIIIFEGRVKCPNC